MNPTKSLIATGLFLLLAQLAFSQAICGFDAVHKRQMNADPVYRQHVQAGEAAIREYIRKHPVQQGRPTSITLDKTGAAPTTLGAPLYTIPVIVHVVHTGGPVGS